MWGSLLRLTARAARAGRTPGGLCLAVVELTRGTHEFAGARLLLILDGAAGLGQRLCGLVDAAVDLVVARRALIERGRLRRLLEVVARNNGGALQVFGGHEARFDLLVRVGSLAVRLDRVLPRLAHAEGGGRLLKVDGRSLMIRLADAENLAEEAVRDLEALGSLGQFRLALRELARLHRPSAQVRMLPPASLLERVSTLQSRCCGLNF